MDLDVQIFNAPNSDPRMTLDIKKVKQLGGGGGSSADVYSCKVKGLGGKFVDKMRKVFANEKLAESACRDMFQEFMLAKELQHQNIIEYKYFMRKVDEER